MSAAQIPYPIFQELDRLAYTIERALAAAQLGPISGAEAERAREAYRRLRVFGETAAEEAADAWRQLNAERARAKVRHAEAGR